MSTPSRVVDLRSDTVTRPTADMRRAMAEAEVGDDVYGEDPTLNRLEETVADLLGHEAGLFTPSGSMANQLGLRVLVRPGEEVLADSLAHVLRAELGAAAAFSGITSRSWPAPRGRLDAELVAVDDGAGRRAATWSRPRPSRSRTPTTSAAARSSRSSRSRLCARARRRPGVAMHLDGARLWNAHVASGVPLATYGRSFETVSVCLSKGLGAPVGSVLVSSAERIAAGPGVAQAVRRRHASGRNPRCRRAFRARAQHRAARRRPRARPAAGPDASTRRAPDVADPEFAPTNIVALDLSRHRLDAAALSAQAAEQGVRISVLGPRSARLVTHLDVDAEGAKHAAEVLAGCSPTSRTGGPAG